MNISNKNLSLQYYCKLFSKIKIHTSKKRGSAPYKPLLLLSVIDLIAQGEIQDSRIYISEKLINKFNQYWDLLSSNSFNGGLALPFFHLKSDGFWQLKFSDEYNGGRPQTIPKLKSDVDYAILDQQLFNLIQDDIYRKKLLDILLEAWFSSNNKQISEIITINHNLSQYEQDNLQLDNQSLNQQDKNKTFLKKSIVRNAFFRKTIVHLYDYRCALCKLKVSSAIRQNIVDGAHIKPLRLFHDNNLNNGLSLCKNHHWAFDNGLFTISDDYRIVVANNIIEESPNNKPIQEFNRKQLLLPESPEHFPRLDALQWHRHNIFNAQ